jgi:hypothetical protein
MSEKEKKMTKAADAPKPGETVAFKIIKDLERAHQRIPKF